MSNQFSAKRFLSESNFQWLIVICCLFIFTGFVCSRAMASIGMAAILVISVLYYGPAVTLKEYLRRKELLALSLFFWIVLVSGLYSDDKSDWLNWVRIKLPYLTLPLGFAAICKLREPKFLTILYGFVCILFISAIVVLANYAMNYQTITESFLMGHAIPIPFRHSHISHIRYTLMIAFALFCCLYLVEKNRFLFGEKDKWLLLFVAIFFFVTLHVLSVRSSLLALYAGLFLLLIRLVFLKKNLVLGLVSLTLLVLIPYGALKFIPSLKNKIEYMRYDYNTFKTGEVKNLSDGVRFISMKGGLELARQNLWLGVGAGDLKTEMYNFYKARYPELPEVDRKMPHNQLIWTLATTGLAGLMLFLIAFTLPLAMNKHYKNWLMALFHLILFSSFFTEATFEEQIGTGFYLTFLLVLMNQLCNE